eukprot:Nitzschia sp. Nitz4//scaffold83_size84149//2236//2778//NITZ4_005159-RA/size84149-processed-gene-0.47-mRNA-1//-1//CDS//3329558902//6935//frame0
MMRQWRQCVTQMERFPASLLRTKSAWSQASKIYNSTLATQQLRQRSQRIHAVSASGRNHARPVQFRCFHTESDYHNCADEVLENIQDAVEEALEDNGIPEFEVVFANGVLTMVFPPHGTWVINKQTPNQQIWWSSPISGPRRYEYEDDDWVFTRDESHSMTLNQALKQEIQQIYDVEVDL